MVDRVPPAQYPASPPLAPPASPVPPGALPPPHPWSTPVAPTPPAKGRPWLAAAAIVVVLALVGAVAAALVDSGDDEVAEDLGLEPVPGGTTDSGPPPTAPSTTTTTAPQDLEEVVADIEAFVAEARGLPFVRDVDVELAADDDFEQRLLAHFDEEVADIQSYGRVLEALGLVEPGTDVVEAVRTLYGGGVVGFYDPETDELVVRGDGTSPYVRTVIAHELTHALDDQHFELDRPELDEGDDDRATAFSALVEGNARRIENAYRDTLTPDEQDEALAEELALTSGLDLFSIPLVLIDDLSLPYVLGPVLVDAILDDGGQGRLDLAYADPPTTTEQVLEPEVFLDGEGAVQVDPPPADGTVLDEGTLGELGMARLVGGGFLTLPGGTDLDDAVRGWGGDRYVVWDDLDGSGSCLRANVVGDTEADTAELLDALTQWADDGPVTSGIDATVEGGVDGAPITLTSCSA